MTAPADLSFLMAELTTALTSDALDELGIAGSYLGSSVLPVAGPNRVVGPAFTVSAMASDRPSDPGPYDALLDSFDEMYAGAVVVIATNGEHESGIWGGLLGTAARARDVAGIVTDGMVRDPDELEALGFPTFGRGPSPLDCAGRLVPTAFGGRVSCGGVSICPQDLIVADQMGVVRVPRAAVNDVAAFATEKLAGEATVRARLAQGESVRAVFDRYGVL